MGNTHSLDRSRAVINWGTINFNSLPNANTKQNRVYEFFKLFKFSMITLDFVCACAWRSYYYTLMARQITVNSCVRERVPSYEMKKNRQVKAKKEVKRR